MSYAGPSEFLSGAGADCDWRMVTVVSRSRAPGGKVTDGPPGIATMPPSAAETSWLTTSVPVPPPPLVSATVATTSTTSTPSEAAPAMAPSCAGFIARFAGAACLGATAPTASTANVVPPTANEPPGDRRTVATRRPPDCTPFVLLLASTSM